MPKHFFTLNRITRAIEHLQNYDSNWVLVPLVFAVNGVGTGAPTNINRGGKVGGDPFFEKHFSGSLVGLPSFPNGTNLLRPRFSELMGNLRNTIKENDYIIHQGTRAWANVYSSRGYREMRKSGIVEGAHSTFALNARFAATWESQLPDTFHFEELLVWLFCFNGFDASIDGWEGLFQSFQETYLGSGGRFDSAFSSRFRLSGLPWESELLDDRPSNEEFLLTFMPSRFTPRVRAVGSKANVIVYGAPGGGKSFAVKQEIAGAESYVTTFHPEYSYADFVGSLRPRTKKDGEEDVVVYEFHPEVFTRAYTFAWLHPDVSVYLVIEEINRGNSAAIFGDIFQLLDRDEEGFSEYPVHCREELRDYLKNNLASTDYAQHFKATYDMKFAANLDDPFAVLMLPDNLFVRATMNTSDQSLFPMDSAFKRRWSWTYVPLRYDFPDRRIIIGEKAYSWNEFLFRINARIYEILQTEDKCLGSFFVKDPEISQEEFRDKILFYVWTDVLRDELPEVKLSILPAKIQAQGSGTEIPVHFNDFFDPEHGQKYIIDLFAKLGAKPLETLPGNVPSV
jgi:hypothetical protein